MHDGVHTGRSARRTVPAATLKLKLDCALLTGGPQPSHWQHCSSCGAAELEEPAVRAAEPDWR